MLVPVILCGGSGARLWPLSRSLFPKQLLSLTGGNSLLQDTALRLSRLPGAVENPVVVCNEAHRFLVSAQLQEVGVKPVLILEPAGRNTAPAVAAAAFHQRRGGDEKVLMLVLPADHVIADRDALAAAVRLAIPAANEGRLVTFGVVPTAPETGYGYVKASGSEAIRPVERFVEKPDYATARRYIDSGAYFWNSGMFLFSNDDFLDELAMHDPEMVATCQAAVEGASLSGGALCLDAEVFRDCTADSIDYAVMEKTARASLVLLDAGWNDVGSFASLHDVSPQDLGANVVHGDVVALDCERSYLRAESRLLTAVGLDGCVVVETKDAVLVAPRERAQDVRKLVDELKARQRPEVDLGREVFRPWGSYDSLENAEGYQVKRLTVLPGAILSLQLHHHRAEHWVVVAGAARVTRGDEVFELQKGGHTHIPVGFKHRIENPGSEILHIIEVQIGDYLGEDDIVRFEDKYGREGRTD
jgi:mannose-1-phosphate guanylyltransferase/mannose-6-phosphate isomerase